MDAHLPSVPTGASVPTGPDAALLAVRQATWQALARILQPGAQITARVVEPLGGNAWLLALRGTTLVAESSLPLVRDSIVRIAVVAGGDQPQLRLMDPPTSSPTAPRADAPALLRQLGLPDTPVLRTAVEAFSARGAPLDASAVQRTATALGEVPANTRLPLAQAHAHVAAAGLPATPLTVAMAARALAGAPADPALRAAPTQTTPPATLATAPTPAGEAVTRVFTAALGTAAPTTAALAIAPGVAAPAGAGLPAAIAVLAQLFPVTALPDPGQGGRPAAMAALALAGLRPESAPTPVAPGAPTAIPGSEPRAAATAANPPPDYPPPALTALARVAAAPGGEALRPTVIEQGAATVLPPPDLADYDLVLPLPLQDRGAPVPARLAVTTRTSGGGVSATWLRVDAELDGLGPVSIRLAGQGGTVAVHLVADGRGHGALTAQADELREALTALGLSASVRVSHPQDVDHG